MSIIRLSTGYTPRPLQAMLHAKLKRFNVLVMHRRFGKTVFEINENIDQSMRLGFSRPELPRPRYAYLAPERDQAKRVSWDYYKHYTSTIPGNDPNEADLRIDIPRPDFKDDIQHRLLGGDNYMSIKGTYLDGVDLDEYGMMHPACWREAIRPALSDRMGWAIISGTPKGRNHFYELYKYATESGDPEWFGCILKASETQIIPKSELDSARRTMSEEEYEQEYECSFQAALVGAYYSKELGRAESDKRITEIPYDPALPVNLFFDLGINDVMAIWFHQRNGSKNLFVEYKEGPDLSIPEWGNIVFEALRSHQCSLGDVVLPHDAEARELTSGKSRSESFRKTFGRRPTIIPRSDLMDGISQTRMALATSYFDKARCSKGIEALLNYQRRWDIKSNVFSAKPMHNWASNGADAFRTFAMGVKETHGQYRSSWGENSQIPHDHAETQFNPYE
jgi:hypothetical protein